MEVYKFNSPHVIHVEIGRDDCTVCIFPHVIKAARAGCCIAPRNPLEVATATKDYTHSALSGNFWDQVNCPRWPIGDPSAPVYRERP